MKNQKNKKWILHGLSIWFVSLLTLTYYLFGLFTDTELPTNWLVNQHWPTIWLASLLTLTYHLICILYWRTIWFSYSISFLLYSQAMTIMSVTKYISLRRLFRNLLAKTLCMKETMRKVSCLRKDILLEGTWFHRLPLRKLHVKM